MGTRERRERERVETREKILAVARELFSEVGYEAVTMRAIANRIEYTPTALYHHFESKQALVTELCLLDFSELARRFQAVAQSPDPLERLQAIGEAYVDFAFEHPSHYRFMFMTQKPPLPDVECGPGKSTDPERNAYILLQSTCAAAIASGRLRPEYDDPDMVAQILWSTLHGAIALRLDRNHDPFLSWRDLRETARTAIGALQHGLLAPS